MKLDSRGVVNICRDVVDDEINTFLSEIRMRKQIQRRKEIFGETADACGDIFCFAFHMVVSPDIKCFVLKIAQPV